MAALVLHSIGDERKTPVFDETMDLASGYQTLRTNSFRIGHSHPPLFKLLAAAPLLAMPLILPETWKTTDEWNFGTDFMNANPRYNDALFAARCAMLAVGLALGWLVFAWGRRRDGPVGGLVALACYALYPTTLGLAGFVGADLPLAATALLSMWWFGRYLETGGLRHAALAGLGLGLSLLVKQSGILVLGAFGVCGLLAGPPRGSTWGAVFRRDLPAGLAACAAAIVLGYGVTGLPWFVEGWAVFQRLGGKGTVLNYLNGEFSLNGWWYYYAYALLVKTPPAMLAFLGGYLWLLVRQPMARGRQEMLLLVPAGLFLLVLSLGKVQVGLRYLFPAWPFLAVLAGTAAARLLAWRPSFAKPALVVGLLWCGVELARVFPYYSAYFNDLAGGSANGWQVMHEIEWPLDMGALRRYVASSGAREVVVAGYDMAYNRPRFDRYAAADFAGAVPGGAAHSTGEKILLVITSSHLKSITVARKDWYAWLWKYTPAARIAYSLFVYDITRNEEAWRHIANPGGV